MNIVLDDAVEEKEGGEKVRIGTIVIRGNSVVMLEVRPSHVVRNRYTMYDVVCFDGMLTC